MRFLPTRPAADGIADVEAAMPELVRDLRLLGQVTAVDRPFLDQLGSHLRAKATASARPTTMKRLLAPTRRRPRPALVAGLALALILSVSGTSTAALANGTEGLRDKVQQVVQLLAGKLGVPAERIQLERQDDGTLVVQLPEGTKANGTIHLFERKALPVSPGTGAEAKVVLDVTGVAAQTLGVSPEQIESELRGRSLAEVAQLHGVALEALADAIRAEVQTQAKDISPAKLDAIVNEVLTQVDASEGR